MKLWLLIFIALPSYANQETDLKYYRWREATLKRMTLESCNKALKSEKIEFDKKASFLENQVCDAKNLVSVRRIKDLEITPPALMTCDLALKFAEWLKTSIQPEAKKTLGTELIGIRQSGTYSCRKMRTLDFISEHAFANAIDIPEFRFKDGSRITVLKNWKGPPKERTFLKSIHKAACGMFPVSLWPEYDKHHENHLHVDLGPLTLCK